MTYSSNVNIRQSVSQDSGLTLYCPEFPPPTFAMKVNVYADTLFGTLLQPRGRFLSGQPEIAGMAPSNSQVVLTIGGKTYRVVSDSNGNFTLLGPGLFQLEAGRLLWATKRFRSLILVRR